MKFNELEVVKTLISFPEEGIDKGEIGAVIDVYTRPEEAYEVEFVNEDGTTKAMFAILPEHLEKY